MINIESYWKRFLEDKDLDLNTKCLEAFHFEVTEKLANELLELVLEGKKRATSSSLTEYESESTVPKIGDYSIVTDWNENPRCVIKTTAVTILPFKDIDFDLCKKEGEDDCLETWREGHIKFFTNISKTEFDENMMVVFEEFEVVYK